MRLVPYAAAHLEPMAELIFDPDVRRFTGFPEPPDVDWLPGMLERYEQGREDGTKIAWAIVGDDGAFLGLGLAVHIDAAAREVELGYAIAPAARGRGVATWVLTELTRWAFEELGALRAELRMDAENAGSRAVAERCGYTREGVRRSVSFKGRRADEAIYSRLPTDPS
jgi:RimJ/RimL family protein N-acetyltransferase